MNAYEVKRLALVLAVQAEIEGYKASNSDRIQMGHSVAHPEEDFIDKATELRELAYKHNEQL